MARTGRQACEGETCWGRCANQQECRVDAAAKHHNYTSFAAASTQHSCSAGFTYPKIPPMLFGYHISFSAYGFWLPNDPRGSGSDHVDAEHLSEIGRPLQVDRSRSVASRQHDDELRRKAKGRLKYPAVQLSGEQALTVALAFGDVSAKLDVLVHACAVLPDHVHLVTGVAEMKSELLRDCFKRAATRRLNAEKLHPLGEFRKENGRVPSPWGEKGWNVFINSHEQLRRVIRYVEENPVKAGLKQQRWSFVTAPEQ